MKNTKSPVGDYVGNLPEKTVSPKLLKQADRLTDLIRTLQDSTKLYGGHPSLYHSKFNFHILTAKQEELQYTSSKHLSIRQLAEMLWAMAGQERPGRVLTHLISAASKNSRNAIKITISCLKNKKAIAVSRPDKGIPEQMQLKVLERYYAVQCPILQGSPRMGWRHNITANIILQHGGTNKVETNVSKPSPFPFTLPQISNRFKKNVA